MAEPETSEKTAASGTEGGKTPRKVNWVVVGAAVGLVVLAVGAILFSFRFVEDERKREMQAWQIRLGIVADSRAAAIDEWIDRNFAALRELTENASLQLYMTELEMSEGDKDAVTDEAAQATYLRNLLVASADRTGFIPPPSAGEINANIERAGVAGLGLADKDGKPIVSTPQMPPLTGKIRTAVAKALDGEPTIIDIYMGTTNQPTIGFVLPVIGIQSDEGSSAIGAVIGVRIIDQDLFDRLEQPGSVEKTAETYLVRSTGTAAQYLTPLADGTRPLKRSLTLDTPDLAAAFALDKPGGFALKRNYAGEEALVTSRPIADLPWVLMRTITRAEALAASETRLTTMLTVLVLVIVGVAVTIIAVWRHGTSVRSAEAAERFRISSERFENMSKFMRLVTDSQPNSIVAVDGTTTYTFANLPAAEEGGIAPEDMFGKTMASVMGPVKAKALAQVNDIVLREFETFEEQQLEDSRDRARKSEMHTFGEEDDDDIQVIKSDHIPLRGDRDHPPGVLMVLSDLTELTTERRRSEFMTRQLINTIVSVIDRRDPFSAHDSTRTAEVARCIAKEMELPIIDVKTVDIAASLMSLGKIFIPTEVLSKGSDAMTPEERQMIFGTFGISADLLTDVPFDGPVVQTIRQLDEKWDGSGPLGTAGDEILLTARIVNVAYMFVRKVSARAHREGMTFDEVSGLLLRETGITYDRRPVSALINYLDNRNGVETWAHFRDRPEGTAA
jgi:response regulator RpfG family c-di-GMP phosphodiesterase